ncbi:MAG TPA: polyprenol monophosphomannose synthase [Jiangellaceae bacterium]|jgi:dolichol-phosphate mannosyltransferase|nr:polyprenol monophosphomannose synthase [Jiangellaceae bacterium]
MVDDTTGRLLVVMPTYNEAATVRKVVERVRAAVPAADVLIVDDSSPDGTGEIADSLAELDSHVHALHRARKEGLGKAYVAGFRWGLERAFDTFVEMDADGSHQPEELPNLLAALRDADVVLGSRYVAGGRVVDWPWHRELLSRGGNRYSRIALGVPLRDITGGYRAYRASALRRLELATVASAGYCFQVDLAWRAVRSGLRVAEVPITFVERTEGASKMSGAIVREALWQVTRWGIAYRVGQLRELRSSR